MKGCTALRPENGTNPRKPDEDESRRVTRLLFVNENLGGHGTMHLHLRQQLEREGSIAEIYDVPKPGPWRRLAALPVPGLARADLDLQPLRYQLAQSAVVRRALDKLHGTYDALHVYTQHVALLSAPLLARCPTVVSIDATSTQNAYLHPYRMPTRHTARRVRLTKRFEKPVYEAATLVVAQSQWAARSLRDDYGIEERVRVIPFGVTVEPPVAHRPQPLPGITYVGSTMRRKGGLELLRVFRRELAGRCTLDLVTQDDVPEEPGVRVHRDFGPGDPRLRELLARTSVFAFPSTMDTFGYAVLEAMEVGVPVVCYDSGGVAELVEDGTSGFVVRRDETELARAIRRLADDPELRARMGAAGRARVIEHFDVRNTTAHLLATIHEALDAHAASRRDADPTPRQ
jgi:glycosyltransferase involved in cell wall biosynthesis